MIRNAETPDSWAVVLPEVEAKRALDVVAAITRDLCGPSAAMTDALPGEPTIALGNAGQAIFYAYLERSRPGEGFGRRGVEMMEQALELLAEGRFGPGLYQGFSGVAWAADHLQESLLAADEDVNADVDDALFHLLRQSPWRRHYDLISGLVGLAVYALSRLPKQGAVDCLEMIVGHLDELAVEQPTGITWFTPREMLGKEAYALFTGGNYNLGVAHGAPGVVAVLARICRAGIAVDKARPLLDGVVSWLRSQRLEGCEALFPTAVGPGVEITFSRAAWCYGDPGIAATLLLAARSVGVASWEQEALEIARHSARRPVDTMQVRDSCLCHGAAGLAHLFNRLYQATGEDVLRQAALHWYRYVLDEHRPGRGVGGFMNWGQNADEEMEWQADAGFLNGAAGIGLALLAAATPVEPRWDEMMLLSPFEPSAGDEAPT